jgi:transketolase
VEAATASVTDERTLDELCINTIRTLSMDAVQKANSGHPGTPMALAPLAYVLYTRILRHSPENPEWFNRDRLVLSAGHASMLLYSALYLTGYGVSLDDLKNFRQLHSPTAGHPEYGHAPGVEATTGPLGQGISNSVGLALAERMLAARFNTGGLEPIDHYTYAICSDGDMMEGVASESCSLAGHLGLGRLIAFYDDNRITIEGSTELAFSESVATRFEGYGWHVQDLGDDFGLDAIERAVDAAKSEADRPSLVILHTEIATGAPHKAGTAEAHGAPLGEDEVKLTKEAYGWPPDSEFLVPDEALARFRESVERGREWEGEWRSLMEDFRAKEPELAEELDLVIERRLPEGWDRDLPKFQPDDGKVATRKASGKTIQWAAAAVPQLVGGSADLAPSNNTLIDGSDDVERGSYGGRNLHFGVREHGMGAITNGLTLHGLRAYGATFLIFSDYMKPAMRLAALMRIPSIFVFTHDSVGLGEDGPTHQPIEQLTNLRATPNLYMVRPADANETALAWRFAIAQTETPAALALSRQSLPILDPGAVPDDAIDRGAYVLLDQSKDEPDLILIATGSEVHIATEAAEKLEEQSIATRVVSMPCMERFAEQDDSYRESVLPSACTARISVEAGATYGWARWVGEDGEAIGLDRFGESAPWADIYEEFGFTAERVADQGKALAEKLG